MPNCLKLSKAQNLPLFFRILVIILFFINVVQIHSPRPFLSRFVPPFVTLSPPAINKRRAQDITWSFEWSTVKTLGLLLNTNSIAYSATIRHTIGV